MQRGDSYQHVHLIIIIATKPWQYIHISKPNNFSLTVVELWFNPIALRTAKTP